MATDKRERQRANREAKQAVEAKEQRRSQRFTLARRWVSYAAIFLVVLFVLWLLTH
jgi:cell division septal protein FtsQ